MINKCLSIIFIIVWFIYISSVFLVPYFLLNRYKDTSTTVKIVFQSLVSSLLKYGFDANLFYINEIKQSENKIDIVMCNHVSTIDLSIILTVFNHFGINNYTIVGSSDYIYIPGFGFHFMIDNHIKLDRNWKEDKQTIGRQLDKINNGVIFIFPEGSRFDQIKRDDGQKHSKKNNLPIYNNLLVPKSKGLWAIFNLLKKKNKMGKIYDMTIIMQNFVGERAHLNDLIYKETGNIFIINRELKHPKLYLEYASFKEWLMNEWLNKDKLIKTYQKLVYKKINIKDNHEYIILNIILFFVLSWVLIKKKEFRYYMITSLILSYIIIKCKKL